MFNRRETSRIQASLNLYPVIGLLGTRQSGKITLAKQLAKELPNSSYFDLENLVDQAKFPEQNVIITEPERAFMVYPKTEAWPLSETVTGLPASQLETIFKTNRGEK